MAVCINNSTLHPENNRQMLIWCQSKTIPVFGQIPYSDAFRSAVQSGKTVLELPETNVKDELKNYGKPSPTN